MLELSRSNPNPEAPLRLDPHDRASLFRLAVSEVAEAVEHIAYRTQRSP